ncbi:MAG: ABC transporter permease [Dactylosporangium sp.]|nr:ABC transporter permease [Dactylosporangium sp.]NNJ63685.1 ABC transporter permease [Dactylosporangium sp.]
MIRAVRSELIKVRTTNTWWLMALGVFAFTALALLFNALNAHFELAHAETPREMPAEQREQWAHDEEMRYTEAHTAAALARTAANLYTSGQFFGVMLIMILGALIVTNEYFHQTATATFLTTPRRTTVIMAKLVTGVILGFGAWAITTTTSVAAGTIFLGTEHVPHMLGEWTVLQSILLNLGAFAMWAVLGIALGTLIRSQIAAVVTGTTVYLIGIGVASLVFNLVRAFLIKEDWVITAQVIVPAVASQIMVTPGEAFPHAAPQWVGAAVLCGYALVAGVIGTLLTRRRDIS